MQSALEREISRQISGLRIGLIHHDRAVVLGLVLSLLPVPPATAAGLLLTLFNLALLSAGKLARSELPLLAIGLTACLGYIVLWYYLGTLVFGLDLPRRLSDAAWRVLPWLHGFSPPVAPAPHSFHQI